MTAILVAMIIVLTIAAGIAGLVVFGMQGRGSQHVPKLTDSPGLTAESASQPSSVRRLR